MSSNQLNIVKWHRIPLMRSFQLENILRLVYFHLCHDVFPKKWASSYQQLQWLNIIRSFRRHFLGKRISNCCRKFCIDAVNLTVLRRKQQSIRNELHEAWFEIQIVINSIIYLFSGGLLAVDDQDPLPNEDVSIADDNISNNHVNTDCITINVTNEHGQKVRDQLQNR